MFFFFFFFFFFQAEDGIRDTSVTGVQTCALPISPGIALSGQVSSKEEGLMEGVLVSAKKDDSTITITVVSDEKGRYSFPASRVGPGHYSLKIRADRKSVV